ncbi:MAG: FAD-dependent oxidoreductase [Propionibacteriaceae bacterium]|jgi:3-oxosteroid 1-dehydrogenase|nr:FAD-dependent oxidoreductase [Propionibacteriaceae bacterium]
MPQFETDLVIAGAGTAGLLAAVAARRLGFEVLVVERTAYAGGTTSGSRGAMWLPANDLAGKLGVNDSVPAALEYLNSVLGDTTDASTAARREGYITSAPKMVRWLLSSRLPLFVMRLPDYHPAEEGGLPQGRVISTHHSDPKSLGDNAARLRRAPARTARKLPPLGFLAPKASTTGTRGESLATELLRRACVNGVEIWFETAFAELTETAGRVTGVVVERGGERVQVVARKAVLLACGGFEASQTLREEHLPLPTNAAWSLNEALNDGSALDPAMALGADTAAMGNAWWAPVIVANGVPYRIDRARQAPHSVIVDHAGDRFFSEAAGPAILGRYLYDRTRGVRSVPSFLIMDNKHRSSYELGPWKAGSTPRKAIDDGDIVRAGTLDELAQQLGIDRAGLIGTVVRFNGFAHKGVDEDFRRGESDWDRFGLGGSKKKNYGLAKLDRSPYWAAKVYPGDTGTKGGLLIDADSRVLRADGSPIAGLYACPGAAASLMKGTSPGPGAGLGEALIAAYRAVLAIDGAQGE